MLGKRKQPSPDHRLVARQKPVCFLPETQIVADIAFQGSMDLASIVQHFFVPTKGELIARIHDTLLPAFETQEDVELFLDQLGKVGGVLTGSLIVAAFCGERQWPTANVDCVVPFNADLVLEKLASLQRTSRTVSWSNAWDSCLHKTLDFGGKNDNRRVRIWVTNANVDPRQFIVDKFDFELVRNFYSPADDVVHIGFPSSLAHRRTFLDSRFNTNTLSRVETYRTRGFTIEFDEISAVRACQGKILIDDTKEKPPYFNFCNNFCRYGRVLSIAHCHRWNLIREEPSWTAVFFPNIKSPRCA